MPIYSYQCEHCETNFEISKDMGKAAEVEFCPQCLEKLVRDYQADNIRFIEPQKTVGSYADKQSQKMTEEQKSDIQDSLNPKKKDNYEIKH